MKRQLIFDYESGHYVLKEDGVILFSIDGKELKFVSLDFYNGVYKNKTAAIELINSVANDELKKGKYIFEWLSDIVSSIQKELNDSEIPDETDSHLLRLQNKQVYLFELAACAGDGFYNEGVSQSDKKIASPFEQADYAVRISGESMEPTISNNSIVFVQKDVELHNGDIGIFVVDGKVMCKRLREENGRRWLQPDNNRKEFEPFTLTDDTSCYCQGLVLVP